MSQSSSVKKNANLHAIFFIISMKLNQGNQLN